LKPQQLYDELFGDESHPAGVRGLKLSARINIYTSPKSHPAGVRGLKRAEP